MRIIILGKGYTGSKLKECLSTCYDVDNISRCEVDYTNRVELFSYLTSLGELPGVVINACGYTGRPNVDACELDKEETWKYNVVVPVNIQKVCKDLKIPMIHISSGCIYDGYDKDYTEEDEPNFGLMNAESSWYSKTKHACEMMLKDRPVYIFRIRMPFCATTSQRNVLMKLLKYDNVIDMNNSMTCLEDLCGFVLYFLSDMFDTGASHAYGVYNVVNPQPASTGQIIEMMKSHGIENKQWRSIKLDELYEMTTAKRSNCVLSDDKITSIGLKLPRTIDSLNRCLRSIKSVI